MQFKEALKAAGLRNPGRTTWCGIATDGTPVFTIWERNVRRINSRLFTWWDYNEMREPDGHDLSPQQRSRARTFITRAADHLDTPCRAVILHTKPGRSGVASAEYPHPRMARVRFLAANLDALQFIAELLPAE